MARRSPIKGLKGTRRMLRAIPETMRVEMAHALQDMGVGKGDRVAFAMRNLPEWPMVFFAITTIGAIAVPLNA